MKISVVCPVLNEVEWIGYSIMACLDDMHEFIYALDEKSSDGTRDLLFHVKQKYAHEKLTILDTPNFHPLDMGPYNKSFNDCIAKATGEAVMFLHPDMILLNANVIKDINPVPLAWTVGMTSYAGDMQTVITKGRADRWKNIHARKFGIHYYGAYGSQNEDFYHTAITGKSYKHYGSEFSKYPFQVVDSGLQINHYCENKPYKRRLEKMKLCLKTLAPYAHDEAIEESAVHHPRVTLEQSSSRFGEFKFEKSTVEIPDVFSKYSDEFTQFIQEPKKELVHG
jgi:glycosyltransferase involved in cell wall biosynthesis